MKKAIIIIILIIISADANAKATYKENINKIKEYISNNCNNKEKNIKTQILNGNTEIITPLFEFDDPKDKKILKYSLKDIREIMKYKPDIESDYEIKPVSDFMLFQFSFENKGKNEYDIFCYSGNYYDKKLNYKGDNALVLLKDSSVKLIDYADNKTELSEKYIIVVKKDGEYYVVNLYISGLQENLDIYKYDRKMKKFLYLEAESIIKEKSEDEKIMYFIKNGMLYSDSFENKKTKKFIIDIDGDGKQEKIDIESYSDSETNYLKSIKINNKNVTTDDIKGAYYFGFLPYKNKLLLAFGFSDNGVNPTFKLFNYKDEKMIKEFDEDFEYLLGIKNGKIITWWNMIFGNTIYQNENYINEDYCIYYYDISTKKWEVNKKIIDTWIINCSKNIFIFSKREDALSEGDKEPEQYNNKNAKKRVIESNGRIIGVINLNDKFKIIEYDHEYSSDVFYIENEKGIKGYITGGHMVFN